MRAVPPAPSPLPLQHPLNTSPSPRIRALPHFELQFQHDLAVTRVYWEVSQLRVTR